MDLFVLMCLEALKKRGSRDTFRVFRLYNLQFVQVLPSVSGRLQSDWPLDISTGNKTFIIVES